MEAVQEFLHLEELLLLGGEALGPDAKSFRARGPRHVLNSPTRKETS
jgi:hypothetical protein